MWFDDEALLVSRLPLPGEWVQINRCIVNFMAVDHQAVRLCAWIFRINYERLFEFTSLCKVYFAAQYLIWSSLKEIAPLALTFLAWWKDVEDCKPCPQKRDNILASLYIVDGCIIVLGMNDVATLLRVTHHHQNPAWLSPRVLGKLDALNKVILLQSDCELAILVDGTLSNWIILLDYVYSDDTSFTLCKEENLFTWLSESCFVHPCCVKRVDWDGFVLDVERPVCR